MKPHSHFSNLQIGPLPRVAGVVSGPELLQRLAQSTGQQLPCDLLEVRLDQFEDMDSAFQYFALIEAKGLPSFVTLRLSSEGGKWNQSDRLRLPLFERALSLVSGVDVELQSEIVEQVSAMAKKAGKACIVSCHDFSKTPPADMLERVIEKAQKLASVSKVITTITQASDIEVLRSLLRKAWKTPVCIMGMGPLGVSTRLDFPAQGSCLTYGYLDRPSAPGQFSAAYLIEHLKTSVPGYANDLAERSKRLH